MIFLYFALACVYCLGVGGMFMYIICTDACEEKPTFGVLAFFASIALLWPLLVVGWLVHLLVEMSKKVITYFTPVPVPIPVPNKTPTKEYPVIRGFRRKSGLDFLKEIKDG